MTELVPLALSVAEAVRVSGLGRTSIYGAIADGKLKIRKAGRRTLIELEVLRAFISGLPEAPGSRDAS